MCLRTVKQANPKRGDLQREGMGWKVYRNVFGKLCPLHRGQTTDDAVPGKGKISSAQGRGSGFLRYTAGFHLYVNRADADERASKFEGRVVCRVKWRGLCAMGTEYDYGAAEAADVLVVKQIIARRRVKAKS